MAINILKPEQALLTENLIIVIYGQPGTGKTTLGFSADKPLLLDFDMGAQRAANRKDVVRISKWEEIAHLTGEDLANYKTLVIDTAGRCLEALSQYLIKQNPKLSKSTGELTLQGYGALNVAFKAWLTKIRSFSKDLVLICHDKEDKNGEELIIRPDAVGSTKVELVKLADFLGYVYMNHKSRILDFNPNSKWLGKNCASLPEFNIPSVEENNHFMNDILVAAKEAINRKTEEMVEAERQFNEVLDMINASATTDELNSLILVLKDGGHPVHKQTVLRRGEELGFVFNKQTRQFEEVIEECGEENLQQFQG